MVIKYRPITIQSCIPKILDGHVTTQLTFIIKNSIIDKHDGFLSGKSTVTSFVTYVNFITNCLEQDFIVDAIYTLVRPLVASAMKDECLWFSDDLKQIKH